MTGPAVATIAEAQLGGDPELRPTWKDSERFVPRAFVRPALRFSRVEAAGGVVMLVAGVAALAWANSGWKASYAAFLATPVQLTAWRAHLDLDLHTAVNDGLMTLFFLLAGLEIKRQVVTGELRDRRAAALPIIAALGGMAVPALVFVLLNTGHAGSRGWGIPVATDIAFAVGVVALAGRRLAIGARIFILTLAVVDDVGGIIVIALFYASGIRLGWLACAALAVALAIIVQRAEVRSMGPYVVLGVVCWYALHHAGVEAAIAGVIFGLITPIRPFHDPSRFGEAARRLIARIETTDEIATEDLARYARETTSPLERVESTLNLWVAFAVVPLFALVNAGVEVHVGSLDSRVVLGVALGLVLGKTVGVLGASWITVKLGIGRLPDHTTWRQMLGLSVTAGIGFTVALFVTGLSFSDPGLTASAKTGVILASIVAGAIGYALLRTAPASGPTAAPSDG